MKDRASNFFKVLFDLNEVPTKIIFVFCILSALILFLPKHFVEALYLDVFRNEFGKFTGVFFLFTLSLLFVNVVLWIIWKIRVSNQKKRRKEQMLEYLKNLSPTEQATIREFYLKNESAINLPYSDPVIKNLANNGIIIRISDYGASSPLTGMIFPFKLNEDIKGVISEEILGINPSWADEGAEAFVNSNRPNWVSTIENFENRGRNIL